MSKRTLHLVSILFSILFFFAMYSSSLADEIPSKIEYIKTLERNLTNGFFERRVLYSFSKSEDAIELLNFYDFNAIIIKMSEFYDLSKGQQKVVTGYSNALIKNQTTNFPLIRKTIITNFKTITGIGDITIEGKDNDILVCTGPAYADLEVQKAVLKEMQFNIQWFRIKSVAFKTHETAEPTIINTFAYSDSAVVIFDLDNQTSELVRE